LRELIRFVAGRCGREAVFWLLICPREGVAMHEFLKALLSTLTVVVTAAFVVILEGARLG